MSSQSKRPSTDLARRHALKLAASTGAKLAALSVLGMTALPGNSMAHGDGDGGRGWGWGRGHDNGHGHGKGEGGGRNAGGGSGSGSASCFVRGTNILTDQGDIAIEDLRIGDKVMTADRGPQPIKWIGRRSFHRTNDRNWVKTVRPIRVAAGALDDQTPKRDVFLSASHAVGVDGHLMPAVFLINGRSVDWADVGNAQSLDYFNLELETHEVIFAEGLPAETFFADGREQFSNFAEYARLYGTDVEGSRADRRFVHPYRGRTAMKGLAIYALSPLVTIPDPMQAAYDRIATRAREQVCA
jgi:hypothetical protein